MDPIKDFKLDVELLRSTTAFANDAQEEARRQLELLALEKRRQWREQQRGAAAACLSHLQKKCSEQALAGLNWTYARCLTREEFTFDPLVVGGGLPKLVEDSAGDVVAKRCQEAGLTVGLDRGDGGEIYLKVSW